MEHYIAKGYTFPDQDWWEEKKADVSFLYTIDEEEDSSSTAQSYGSRKSHEETGALGGRERSEHTIHESKVRLDSWIEDARQEVGPTAASRITSLAGYVNLAYPIMKTLTKKKRGYYEGMEIKNKDFREKIHQAAANLQRATNSIDRIRSTLSNARVPAEQAETLRALLLRRSTRIVENCELVNVLMNVIKNSARTPAKVLEENRQSKIYGSSVDLI